MSTQKLIEKIQKHTVTPDEYQPTVYLRLGGVAGIWEVQIYGASIDEYQQQKSDRVEVLHHRTKELDPTASIHIEGTAGASADMVLRIALDFVKTETPVPA